MIRKRCGVNLGREILNEAKQIFEVHNFWRKLSPLNAEIKKASKGEFQKNRLIIIESEALHGLKSWLKQSKSIVLINPTDEEMRKGIGSSHACFLLFTPDEYMKRQEIEDFQRIIKKLPSSLDLSIISQNSRLSQEEVCNAFSEVNELPDCARHFMEMKESTLVNLIAFLILLRNYQEFCCEVMFCTQEKIEKCKECLSKFSLLLKQEFFDLLRLNGIYYPLSLYLRHQFPKECVCVDLSLYVKKFASPLELAIFLHDAYQMGVAIYPGFGITTDIEDKPDAYLLDYIYPLEKSIPLERVSALIFLSALQRNGSEIKEFLEEVIDKIERLPFGADVRALLLKSLMLMNNCYDLWHFCKEDVSLLYAIWKLKRMLELSYQRTKAGLSKPNYSKVKAFVERVNSILYGYKDFLEHDLALELGINLNLVKGFFKNINELAKDKNEVEVLEELLLLYHESACNKLRDVTISYATRKISASQVLDEILLTLNQMDDMNATEILELLPYVVPLLDYPIFDIEEKISFVQLLRNKQCDQRTDIIDFIKKAIVDEIAIRPSLLIEVDKLVNLWDTGNPLNFFTNMIQEKLERDQFDSELFEKVFKIFCSLNTLKLFRREPSRFFDYQCILDKYISLQIKKSEKHYFDYFQPITSMFDTLKKLHEENKKVVLLIFDGLSFIHCYFACLEISQKESKQLAEFSEYIVNLFKKEKAQILSSCIPTLTGVNHIALFFGDKLLYDDSFLIKETDNSFMSDKGEDKAKVFSILDLNEQERKSATLRHRLEECNLQRPTSLWDEVLGRAIKEGLLISTNQENTFLSYLFKGNATFKQVGSYASAIDEALLDKNHDLVISQVNLMDAFLHHLNTRYPPAVFNDVIQDYWAVYLDLWKSVVSHICNGLRKLEKGTVVIISADHGLALGRTTEVKRVTQILNLVKGIKYLTRFRTSELIAEDDRLIGSCISGGTSRKFLSIFLLKNGIDKKEKIREALELAQQSNEVIFKEIEIEENKRNLTIKPDFLVFPTIGMFVSPKEMSKKKYYGGVHGGISMCELFIPLIQLEK